MWFCLHEIPRIGKLYIEAESRLAFTGGQREGGNEELLLKGYRVAVWVIKKKF